MAEDKLEHMAQGLAAAGEPDFDPSERRIEFTLDEVKIIQTGLAYGRTADETFKARSLIAGKLK